MHKDAFTRIASSLEVPQSEGLDLTCFADRVHELRSENQVAVMRHSLAMLQGPLAPGEIRQDWLLTFFDLAASACDERRRELAARLLAYELLRPGFISRSSLMEIAALDDSGLDAAEMIARFACNGFILRLPGPVLESRGISQSLVDLGEELGLLLPSEGRAKIFGSQAEDRFVYHLPYRDRLLRVEHDDATRQLMLPVIRLTRAATDLAAVLRVPEDIDYLMRATAYIQKMGFRVTQSIIIGRDFDPNIVRHNGFSEIVPLAAAWD